MAKTQNLLSVSQDHGQVQIKPVGRGTKTVAPTSHNSDFVRKAKVQVSPALRAEGDRPALADFEKSDPPVPPSQTPDVKPSTSVSITLVGLSAPATNSSVSLASFEKKTEGTTRREVPTRGAEANQTPGAASALGDSGDAVGVSEGGGGSSLAVEDSELSKEEEHNYSLFLTRSRAHAQLEDDDDKDDEEEAEEDEGDGLEMDDEDHDEGFGSEHELSENDEEEEEEEEDEDYEADKDDDMSDAFSEPGTCYLRVYICWYLRMFFFLSFPMNPLLTAPGCDMELTEDVKGLTAGVSSRKRGKRRYFWEYSEQLTPSKQERMLKPSEWDRHTLPSNLYQKNGPLHGTYTNTHIYTIRTLYIHDT